MFDCKKCEVLQEEIKFLREQNQKLTDHALVSKNGHAFAAIQKNENPEEFYGSSSNDEYIGYDNFGQKVLLKKDIAL